MINVKEIDWLGNSYVMPITVGGISYNTVEHAYQAAKFKDVEVKREIAKANTAKDARNLGRKNTNIRSDWNNVRRDVMAALIRKKFENEILADRLMKTGSESIIMEGYDDFWGTGRDGGGENTLGEILQEVRAEIQAINGFNSEEEDSSSEDNTPSLEEAILHNPDGELAIACQELFDAVKSVLSYVDKNDLDAEYIANHTGAPYNMIRAAIDSVKSAKAAVSNIESLLSSTDSDEEDEREDDHCSCDTCVCSSGCDDEDDDECFD
jgi:ribA/ribD-fused uncharacterized protein